MRVRIFEIETGYKDKVFESGALLENYEEACEWITSLGIDYRPTRFNNYIEDTKLLFHKEAKSVKEYSSDHDFKEVAKRYLNANREINELLRIFNALKKIEDNDSFIVQLKKWLQVRQVESLIKKTSRETSLSNLMLQADLYLLDMKLYSVVRPT